MKYYLFLDDERDPKKVTWVDLPLVEWVIVRNYNEFINTITERGLPTIVSFDHDIDQEHYQEYHRAHTISSPTYGTFRYDTLKEKTGYDCAKWLAQYCVDKNQKIPQYYIHTMNPIGGSNIISILESANRIIQVK